MTGFILNQNKLCCYICVLLCVYNGSGDGLGSLEYTHSK